MRISDWSSDVCSSDLDPAVRLLHMRQRPRQQFARLRDAILLEEQFSLKGRAIGGKVRPVAEFVDDILPRRLQDRLGLFRTPLRALDPRLQKAGEQVAVERSERLIMIAREIGRA